MPQSNSRRLHQHAAIVLLGMLPACTTGDSQPAAGPAPAAVPVVAIAIADLPGRWGLASYRVEADRERTQAEAKSACSNPYTIEAGATGGVMMHLVDQGTPTELFLKTDSTTGGTFLGPPGPPAVLQDRLIVSYDQSVLVAEWLDASARERYGTMVFVRCA